jgi:hypothetical protein
MTNTRGVLYDSRVFALTPASARQRSRPSHLLHHVRSSPRVVLLLPVAPPRPRLRSSTPRGANQLLLPFLLSISARASIMGVTPARALSVNNRVSVGRCQLFTSRRGERMWSGARLISFFESDFFGGIFWRQGKHNFSWRHPVGAVNHSRHHTR